jgi:hypothetical protein
MPKLSEPMIVSMNLLYAAYEKAGDCYSILSEQLGIKYQSVRKMYEFNCVPEEKYLLRVEKFLKKENYKPRATGKGRPPKKKTSKRNVSNKH